MDDRVVCIPGWRVIRTIGKGSFGTVYEIEKEDGFGGGIRSALKAISIPESSSEIDDLRNEGYDEKSLTALFKSRVEDITSEFHLMSKLKGCSNIVSFEDYSIVQHEDDPGYNIYIRMELLTTLLEAYGQELTQNGFNDRYVQRVGIDICRALELCSKFKIIHRDIKPQNIFVNELGDFKLGDFGIAKISDHTTRATKTGTYNYMAPEVYWGRAYNASVDIYSLGMVLYWMLNERRGPFVPLPPEVPKPSQNAEALERRMHGEPIPAPKHGSRELKRIVLKACAFDPKDRYASPEEMRLDLEYAVGEQDTPETTVVSAEQMTAASIPAKSDGQRTSMTRMETGTEETVYATECIETDELTKPFHDADATAAVLPREQIQDAKPRYCPRCGRMQKPEALFCTVCGAPQTAAGNRGWTTSVMTGPNPNGTKAEAAGAVSYTQGGSSDNGNKRSSVAKSGKKKWIIPTAVCTVLLLLALIILGIVLQRGKKTSTQEPGKEAYISIPTEIQTAEPIFAYTSEPMSETLVEPTEKPTPTPKPTIVTYTLDDYCSDHGMQSGTKYSSEIGSNIGCMWRSWSFLGSTGRIEVANKVRDNALLFFAGNVDKKEIVVRDESYIGLRGYFTLDNNGYEELSFTLGAASSPEIYYGPVSTHGWYRVQIYADGVQKLNTGWLDYASINYYSIDIAGASTITFALDQTYGSTYDPNNVNYTLNLVIFDTKFIKTIY